MEYKDYYKIMGVDRNASEKDIKMAYRRLARKYHPDISKETNAEEKFKEVGEAYDVLRDAKKRKVYDQYAEDWEAKQHYQQSTHKPFSDEQRTEYGGYSPEFFESLFGTGSPFTQHYHRAGADYRGNVTISLEEAYHGAVKDILLPGDKHGHHGAQTLRVKIPAGVKSGQQIRLAGKGGPGMEGAPAGDLYLTINVDKHPLFDVMGNDIYLTLPITPWEAALGTTVVVPTLAGKVDLKIPAGSQGGQTLRLKQRGLPGKTSGDQYVLLKIMTPQPTSEAAETLYRKMAEEMPFNPREKMSGV